MQDDQKKDEPELHSDAWQRFERAVDVVSKSSPQHRAKAPQSKDAAKQKKPKKRAAS